MAVEDSNLRFVGTIKEIHPTSPIGSGYIEHFGDKIRFSFRDYSGPPAYEGMPVTYITERFEGILVAKEVRGSK